MSVRVTVNGELREVRGDETIADLVRRLGRDPLRPGMAVAVNGAVLPRRTWSQRRLTAGDRVEVLDAVQGG